MEWVWGLLQPGFVRWAPPPASQNHFNHWFYSHSTALQPFDNLRYDCRLSYARAAALRNYIRQPDCVLTAAVILAVATLLDRLHANHGELIYHHVILNVYIRCLRKVSRMFFCYSFCSQISIEFGKYKYKGWTMRIITIHCTWRLYTHYLVIFFVKKLRRNRRNLTR